MSKSPSNEMPHQVGRRAELIVQKNLWRRNYRVKDVSRMKLGYDILVNEKYRVEIKSMRGPSTTIKLDPSKFDVFCVIALNDFRDFIYYLRDKKDIKLFFRSTGVIALSTEIIKKHFTRKPQEVFGEPITK